MSAMQPHEYPRRVLAMAVGLTPQVVTETVYALALAREPAWVPTEIRILTTSEGALRARLTLLDADGGQFWRMCSEYGLLGRIQFGEADIVVMSDDTGRPLQDIRSPHENALAADAITAFVRELCTDDQAAVHVSIAGGRKTMGYYMGYALSLFGREQDRLSHVLVNEPFEASPDFFYPPAKPRVIFVGPSARPATTADARIELAEIPFVRLRYGVPGGWPTGSMSFREAVERAGSHLLPARLRFLPAEQAVLANGVSVRLPPLLWAWYWMMARARAEGVGHDGMVRADEVEVTSLLAAYTRVSGEGSDAPKRLAALLAREQGVSDAFFREKNAKVNRLLQTHLGVAAAEPFRIRSVGRRPYTRSGLTLARDCLELGDATQ
jgi:CRISPR-associated protein (TIGR02584 family)